MVGGADPRVPAVAGSPAGSPALRSRIGYVTQSPMVSSHVMDEATRCDRLLLMRDGHIIVDCTPSELLERTLEADPERAFLGWIAGALILGSLTLRRRTP